ncbi:MAG: phosphatidylinositol 4-kinase, partial [Sphaerochaeta sp.]|nr:phosphatidylinositol 4-kinase [Sphaerochaeta sp.]
ASRSAPALVLKTFIPASCVISTALTGFGTPGTEELVLAGGEYEALVHQRFEGRVKEGSFVTIDDRVTFLGGASAGGGGSGGGAGGISFLPGTVEVATYDDVVKLMGAGLSIREFPYLIDPANQIHAMGKATIHADMTGGMAQSLKFANNGGLVLRVSREGIGITGSGVLEPAGIRRLQNLLLDLKLPTNADTYMIFDLKSNSNRMATFNGLIEARRAEDLSPLKYKMLQDSGLLSDSKLLAKLSRTKARNYLVDDPANRDWVKLLLVLESQASRADGAGGTSKADGKKDFVTLKDERIVFLGGAGEGGGASGGAGGIEFGPGGYVSNSDYQAYMNSNGVSAEALEEMGKLFRAHSAGGPAQEHGDAAIEAYWNDPTSEVGRALHLTADLEEAAAQNETAKRHHRLQEELDEIRSLAPEVITPDKYDDAYLLLRANPRSDASYGEGFYAREHAYQVEMLQRELQQPISMYRKSAPTDTNRQVLSYSLSAEGADFSPLTGGNFLVPDTSVPVLDSGHSILYGFARSYGSPGESEVVVIRTRTGEKSFVTLRDGRTIFIGGPDSGGGGGATSLTTVTGTSSAGKPFEATVGGAVDPRIVGKSRSLLLAPGGMIITAVDNEIMHADLAEAVGLHPADYDHSQRFITYPDHLYTTTTSLGSTQIGLAECFDNLQRASLRLIEGGYSPDTQMVLAVPGKGPVRLTLAEWTDGKKALAEKVGHFATIDDRVVFMGGAGAGGGGASGTSSFAKAATTGHATKVQGLGGGVCQAELISYEDDGQGVWKATDAANGHDGTNEVAAYGLSKLLGGDEVPETVFSPGPHGKPGTSQEFVADGATSLKFYLDHGSDDTKAFIDAHRDQVERIVALDFMIGNNDRHNENFLLSESRGIVAIDHGHAHWGWMYLQNNELLQWA